MGTGQLVALTVQRVAYALVLTGVTFWIAGLWLSFKLLHLNIFGEQHSTKTR
jgi:hypothetical protein